MSELLGKDQVSVELTEEKKELIAFAIEKTRGISLDPAEILDFMLELKQGDVELDVGLGCIHELEWRIKQKKGMLDVINALKNPSHPSHEWWAAKVRGWIVFDAAVEANPAILMEVFKHELSYVKPALNGKP